MKSGRRATFTVIFFICLSVISMTSSGIAASKVIPGSKCLKAGISQSYNGKKYTCIKLGTKLYWDNGVKISVSRSTPTPTPTPTLTSVPAVYKPEVGQCFSYDLNQADLKNVSDTPINCNLSHTAETYKVQVWDSKIDVYQDTDENIVSVVRPICTPLTYKPGTIINYWIFSFPSELQWKQGTRWVRCDAVSIDRSSSIQKLIAWTGEPPVKLFTPATCTVESAKSRSWSNNGDDPVRVRLVGFLLRNSSPDRDATLVRINATFKYANGTSETELFEISRIPAGQQVGVGRTYETSMEELLSWSYSAKCSDSPMGSVARLIETSGSVLKESNDSRYGLVYQSTLTNTYSNVIRCKNDNYSCLAYVLFYDRVGGIVGGDTITLNGPVYPGDKFTIEGSIYYPKSLHPENISSYRMWIQEPQS